MKTFETWCLTSNSDLTEGRGIDRVVARFSNERAARDAYSDPRFSRYCVMGVKGSDPGYQLKQEVVVIHDTASSFWDNTREEVRKRAIAKLTVLEQEALGLK